MTRSHQNTSPDARVATLIRPRIVPVFLSAVSLLFALPLARAQLPDTKNHDIFARAAPAVVKIFGAGAGREHGYGTGVLVSADGKMVTALSLLVMGRNIRAVTADGIRHEARVVRTDESLQLALLKIPGDAHPFLSPAEADDLKPGDPVFALTNCFKIADGDEQVSMSRGILSIKLPALQARRLTQSFDYSGPVLVHDAITANPGAAGGPLLDADGRFIGLIGKIVEASATNTRLNYAIPGEIVRDFLLEKTSPRATPPPASAPAPSARPYIGIKLSDLGYRHVSAYVERVRPESPAAVAGIRPDDLVVAIDGRNISDASSYREATDRLSPGQTVHFTIKRGQQVILLPLTVSAEP